MHRIGKAELTVVCLLSLVVVTSSQASAIERASGDYFVYDLQLEVMGIQVVGEIRYEFEGTSTYAVGAVNHSVNVMGISGTLTGGVQMISFLTGNLGGTAYETRDGAAIVGEEMIFFVNATLGTGQFALVNTAMLRVNSTFSPPVLSQFDPSSTSPGDEWSETVAVSATNSTWLNGEPWGDPVTTNTTIEYHIAVADALEDVSTETGTFECLKIVATNDSAGSLHYWWSSKVGNFVKILTYEGGETEPIQSLVLSDYRHERPADIALIIAAGAGVLVAAIALLAFVLIKMRRKPPEQEEHQRALQIDEPP